MKTFNEGDLDHVIFASNKIQRAISSRLNSQTEWYIKHEVYDNLEAPARMLNRFDIDSLFAYDFE